MKTFKGCTALITGASSGLGAEFARQLAPHARCLILAARRLDRLEELKARLARPGLTVHCLTVDLADADDVTAFLEKLHATGESVSFLINNAGLGDHGLFESSDWARVESMIEVNITALTRLAHALVPPMVAARRGAVLNVGSIAGMLPLPHMAVYAATKAYVNSFSEALRAELRGTGVTVTAVCPGPVETEFFTIAERTGSDARLASPEWWKVPADQVVREALAAVRRDGARVIPGLIVCAAMTVATLVPIYLLRHFLRARRPGA